MNYLLDTDTFIFLLRGYKKAAGLQARVRARKILDQCRQEKALNHQVGLSAITIAELEFGSRNSKNYQDEMKSIKLFLRAFAVISVDGTSTPRHYGHIKHELRKAGQSIEELDLLIAAHALALPATLVTNNTAHFNRVPGLKTVNWS